VTGGVLIPGIESRHESGCEGEARPPKPFVRPCEIFRDNLFLLIEVE
jgi:hypothetical protein